MAGLLRQCFAIDPAARPRLDDLAAARSPWCCTSRSSRSATTCRRCPPRLAAVLDEALAERPAITTAAGLADALAAAGR